MLRSNAERAKIVELSPQSASIVQAQRNFMSYFMVKRSPSALEQDGSTSHTARYLMTLLREMFPNHVISKFGDINWRPGDWI